MDIALLTGAPRAITLDGAEYKVSPLRPRDLGELQAWIKDRVPHPIDALKPHLDGLDPAERQALLKEAYKEARDWPPSIGSDKGAGLLATEGRGKVLEVVLRRHQPGITPAEAEALAERITGAEFVAAMNLAFGREGEAPKATSPSPAGDGEGRA